MGLSARDVIRTGLSARYVAALNAAGVLSNILLQRLDHFAVNVLSVERVDEKIK